MVKIGCCSVNLDRRQVRARSDMLSTMWDLKENQGQPLVYKDPNTRSDFLAAAMTEYLSGDSSLLEARLNKSELSTRDVFDMADYYQATFLLELIVKKKREEEEAKKWRLCRHCGLHFRTGDGTRCERKTFCPITSRCFRCDEPRGSCYCHRILTYHTEAE